jgi:hypothetical protein
MSIVNPPPIPIPNRNMTTASNREDKPTLLGISWDPAMAVLYGAVKPSGYFSWYATGEGSAGTLIAWIPIGAASSGGAVPGAPQNPICSNHHLHQLE